jgi:hypothetical protein
VFDFLKHRRLVLLAGSALLAFCILLVLILGLSSFLGPSTPSVSALTQIRARMNDPKADPNQLRQILLKLRVGNPGTPEAREAAVLLTQLPSPLDGLEKDKIPASERAAGQPAELVAVLGQRAAAGNVISAVAIDPSGSFIATIEADKVMRLWDPPANRVYDSISSAQGRGITAMAFAPEGSSIAWGDSGNEVFPVIIRGIAKGKPQMVLKDHQAPIRCLAFSPDGMTLVSGGADQTAKLWNVASGQKIDTLPHKGTVSSLAFSPDGLTLATATEDSSVTLWDVATRKARRTLTGHSGLPATPAFSPDGALVACAGAYDNEIKVWDTASGEKRSSVPVGSWPLGMTYFADGQSLMLLTGGGQLIHWDLTAQKAIRSWQLNERVTGLAVASDQRHIAIANANGTVYILRLSQLNRSAGR